MSERVIGDALRHRTRSARHRGPGRTVAAVPGRVLDQVLLVVSTHDSVLSCNQRVPGSYLESRSRSDATTCGLKSMAPFGCENTMALLMATAR